jgi:16S rRNA (guanine527-N7)-methyltransferase
VLVSAFFFNTVNFSDAIKLHQKTFGIDLSDDKISALDSYYQLIQQHNEILHLVAPCEAEEFATRHILESLVLLEFLPINAKFADIGTGAGLPSIPCLIARDDLRGVLIESKAKKVNFLIEAVEKCGLENRARIVNRQFEEIVNIDCKYVTCRALDKFTKKLPNILSWAEKCNLLFFGGNSLRDELKKNKVKFNWRLMPLSEQRFLFMSK